MNYLTQNSLYTTFGDTVDLFFVRQKPNVEIKERFRHLRHCAVGYTLPLEPGARKTLGISLQKQGTLIVNVNGGVCTTEDKNFLLQKNSNTSNRAVTSQTPEKLCLL